MSKPVPEQTGQSARVQKHAAWVVLKYFCYQVISGEKRRLKRQSAKAKSEARAVFVRLSGSETRVHAWGDPKTVDGSNPPPPNRRRGKSAAGRSDWAEDLRKQNKYIPGGKTVFLLLVIIFFNTLFGNNQRVWGNGKDSAERSHDPSPGFPRWSRPYCPVLLVISDV